MSLNAPCANESIAGVRGEVVSVLTPEDRAFLKLLAHAGMTLEGVFNRITEQEKNH